MDQSLAHYLELFRDIIDFFPDYIFIKDTSFRYQLANRLWIKQVGCTEENYKGKRDMDLFPPEIAESYRKSDEATMELGTFFGHLAEQVTDEGNQITIAYSKCLLRGPTGTPCGILGIFRDLTLEYEEKERFLRLKDMSIQTSIEGVSFFNSQ